MTDAPFYEVDVSKENNKWRRIKHLDESSHKLFLEGNATALSHKFGG